MGAKNPSYADNVEFLDCVRAVIGLDPIPGAPCSRNRARRKLERLGTGVDVAATLEQLGHDLSDMVAAARRSEAQKRKTG